MKNEETRIEKGQNDKYHLIKAEVATLKVRTHFLIFVFLFCNIREKWENEELQQIKERNKKIKQEYRSTNIKSNACFEILIKYQRWPPSRSRLDGIVRVCNRSQKFVTNQTRIRSYYLVSVVVRIFVVFINIIS